MGERYERGGGERRRKREGRRERRVREMEREVAEVGNQTRRKDHVPTVFKHP